MRDMILLIAIIAMMVAGYFQMGKIGDFIKKNQRISAVEDIRPIYNIIIATQTNDIINILNHKLGTQAGEIGFIIRKMGQGTILKKLESGKIEIAVLSDLPDADGKIKYKPIVLGGKNLYMLYKKGRLPVEVNRGIAIVENSQYSQ